MKHYKLNGTAFTCPENWREVTLEQLLKINTGINKPIEAIVICTGIPESEWAKSTDYALIEEITMNLDFIKSPDGFKPESKPRKIVFNEVEVSSITDIGKLSIGQYEDLKLEIAEFFKEEGEEIDRIRKLSLYPKIAAIYLQPFITGSDYDFEKAEEITKQLYQHSAMEVSEWGAFFIQRYQELRTGILKDVQKLVILQSKQRPGFLGYLKILASKLFSIVYPGETLKSRI